MGCRRLREARQLPGRHQRPQDATSETKLTIGAGWLCGLRPPWPELGLLTLDGTATGSVIAQNLIFAT
jgi:hypothetical protein